MERPNVSDQSGRRAGPALTRGSAHRLQRRLPATVSRSPVGGWPIAAVLAVATVMLYAIRYAMLPFVFATAIAFAVDPAVAWLVRRIRLRRWVAVIPLYLLIASALAAIVYLIGFEIISGTMLGPQVGQSVAELLKHLLGPDGVTLFGRAYPPEQIVSQAREAMVGMLGPNVLVRIFGLGATAIFGLTMLFVLLPYLMISGPRLAAGAIWLIPPERRRSIEALLPQIIPVLRRYLIGVCVVVSYTSLMAWLGFGIFFGLPHAALLAIAVGLLEIVPVLGPVIAATLAAGAAFQHGTYAAMGLVAPVGFIVALRLSIDNLVGPLVLGQAARLHPVVVMFAFVCGAMLFGAIGLLLAVPVAVIIKVTLRHYYAEPIVENADQPEGSSH